MCDWLAVGSVTQQAAAGLKTLEDCCGRARSGCVEGQDLAVNA
jgi:hypothetical protein